MALRFSTRLKKLLATRKISIAKLAREMQVSRQAVYNWIANDNISGKSLKKLSRYLGVTQDWLKYGSDSGRDILAKAQKNTFLRVVNNPAFSDTKLHLTLHDVLVGSYYFSSGEVTCYNSSTALNPRYPYLNKLEDMLEHVGARQARRIHLAIQQLLNCQKIIEIYINCCHNTNIYQLSLVPIFDREKLIEGLSFSVRNTGLSDTDIMKHIKAKCNACVFGHLYM